MSTTIPKRSDWVFDDRIPYDGSPLKKESWIKKYSIDIGRNEVKVSSQ